MSSVLAHSSRYHKHHDHFLGHSQRFPLYPNEASSSQTSIPPHHQHDQSLALIAANQSYESNSTSSLLAEDPVPSESDSFNHHISSFLNDHQSTGQASHQRKRKRISHEYIDFGNKTFNCCHCNALFWLNERLAHSSQSNPKFSLCYLSGKIKLPRPPTTPHPLDDLLNSIYGQKSNMFRRNIHAYNSMFAFTSMGANIDQSVNHQPGPYVFKINGHCHHLMGSLLSSDDSAPKFPQLYIYDLANEVSNRMSQFPHSTSDSSLDKTIVADLIQMLTSTNCLVGLFRHASQKLSEPGNPGYKLQLLGQRTSDTKQYNYPTSDDIGGLIVGDIGGLIDLNEI
uniref:Helitron helicase-like domain-containing protein n=1 Tax=Salix viminalis TaxID=40686 RepID=A0A6N2KT28_SALVM